MMNSRWFYFSILCAATITLFMLSNNYLRGYLRSDEYLAKEIQSPRDSLYQYRLSEKAPFKYRLLFPAIIKGTHALVYDRHDSIGFYYTYKFWSCFFFVTSACLFFILMTVTGFSDRLSLLGALIFILLPPVLMAYTLPVHTREDPLAYSIFLVGLIALLKERRILFLITCVVGVLCRETMLLLPLLYFFFANDKNVFRRFLLPFIPGAVWIFLRLLIGRDQYDAWEGLRWNMHNPEQVVGFLFITFNICWLAYLTQYYKFRKKTLTVTGPKNFFYRTSVFTLLIILTTTFLGGIYNEIRLLYLFSPWMIFFFLDALEGNRNRLSILIRSTGYLIFATASLLVFATVMYLVLKYQHKLIVPGPYAVPYHLWIIASSVYLFLTAVFIPVFFSPPSSGKNIPSP